MAASPGRTARPTGAVVAVLSLAGTTVSLQQTLVVALLPSFAELLGVSGDDVSWLITATLVTAAVATPTVSRLADMYGKRLMMLVCIALMTLGSVVAALSAGSFAVMIIGRSLQGFAAALIPVGISILRDELPQDRVPSAIALMSATLGIGGALGLPLGGVLYGRFGWASVFWLSAAVGVAILAAVLLVVPESRVRTRGRFDLLGALLLSAALICLLLVISKGARWSWELVTLLLIATAALLAAWFPHSLKTSQPLVDLRTSARRPVLFTNIASILAGFALMANLLASSLQLQLPLVAGGYGLSAIEAGLAMMPGGLAMVLFSPVSGKMISSYGGRLTLITGCAIMAVAYVGRVFLDHSLLSVVIGATVVSIGSAIAYAAMPSLIMANVPITETASANGLNALLRALGTSVASAVIAALLTNITMTVDGQTLTSPTAFVVAYGLAAIVCLAACGIVWLVPRPAAEPGLGTEVDPAAAVAQGGGSVEVVVAGRVLRGDGSPHPNAVVTAVRLSGEPLDWSRADSAGGFSLALPGRDRYLVIVNADGWAPHSEVVDFAAVGDHDSSAAIVCLGGPLLLTGTVTSSAEPVSAALVTLSDRTGEVTATTRTDAQGGYRLRLPPPGHHILTVLSPDHDLTRSAKIFTTTQSAIADIELGPGAGSSA